MGSGAVMARTIVLCCASFILGSCVDREPAEAAAPISDDLRDLFGLLDTLNPNEHPLVLVELRFSYADRPDRQWSENVWLVRQDDSSISVMRNDLLPWTFSKNEATQTPASWYPRSIKLEGIKEADLREYFKSLSIPEPLEDEDRPRRRLSDIPGPSQRLLQAYMAWKHGLPEFCDPIIAADAKERNYKADFARYQEAVLDDLAWLHFLRGVNLLMYADRKDVLQQLRLVSEISPKGEYSDQAKELVRHLERMVAGGAESLKPSLDESKMGEAERIRFYVTQLKDLNCPQMSQPGDIAIYATIVDGQPDENPPSAKLLRLVMKAVPFLIEALDDDTPTRTVYHWRDFAHSRYVWRTSDFAWQILRDITKKEFGYRPVVGFTLGTMEPAEKKTAIEAIKQWYAENKNVSDDDRMFGFFSSQEPNDWLTAGRYFLDAKKSERAVKPLLELIPRARDFSKGAVCELVGELGDRTAIPVLNGVMTTAPAPADRMSAAIGLWRLGDNSGIPIAIDFVESEMQPYGNWEEPIWFLMLTRSKEAMDALQSIIVTAPPTRASEVLRTVTASITGDLWGRKRTPAACVEMVPVLIAAADRRDETGGSTNDVKTRMNDVAAVALVLMRNGTEDPFPGSSPRVDPTFFDVSDPEVASRDRQIEALKAWYETNKDHLRWSPEKKRLVVTEN